EGGILQQPMHMLQVRAKPRDIPEEIVVNVESLEIGDSISVSDVKETDKFEILDDEEDRKSTRLNSSHVSISYAVFCLKKKNKRRSNIEQEVVETSIAS